MSRLFPRSNPSGLKFTFWIILGCLVVLLDQLSKYYFQRNLEPMESLPIFGCLNLVLAHNTGAAFSFLSDAGGWQRYFFSGVAVAVCVGIIWLLKRYNHHVLFSFALTLLAAGAVGNLIDRVHLGYVIDFIDFHVNGWHWPAFNLADAAICCGAFGIILDEILGLRRR